MDETNKFKGLPKVFDLQITELLGQIEASKDDFEKQQMLRNQLLCWVQEYAHYPAFSKNKAKTREEINKAVYELAISIQGLAKEAHTQSVNILHLASLVQSSADLVGKVKIYSD